MNFRNYNCLFWEIHQYKYHIKYGLEVSLISVQFSTSIRG